MFYFTKKNKNENTSESIVRRYPLLFLIFMEAFHSTRLFPLLPLRRAVKMLR